SRVLEGCQLSGRPEVRAQPAEDALPSGGVPGARLGLWREPFVAKAQKGPTRNRLELVGERRLTPATPGVAPGLHQPARRLDDEVRPLDLERRAFRSGSLGSPRSADAHLSGPAGGAVGLGRSPPADDLLGAQRPEDPLGSGADLH